MRTSMSILMVILFSSAMKLNDRQRQVAPLLAGTDKSRVMLYGGAQSSKSTLLAMWLRARALQFPGSHQIVCRKTEEDCREKFWNRTLKPILEADGKAFKLHERPTFATCRNGSVINIGGLADSQIDKVLGPNYVTVAIDEASEVSYRVITPLETRLSEVKADQNGIVAVNKLVITQNPPTKNHWTYKLFVLKQNPETGEPLTDAEIYAYAQMNPIHNKDNLPAAYLKMLQSKTGRDKLRFWDGEFGQTSGLVYGTFDPERHIIDDFEIPDDARRYRIIDFGFTNPFVCLWIALLPDDTAIIYREHYLAKVTVPRHALIIHDLTGSEFIEETIADHDAGDREILNENDIPTRPANKNVDAGLDRVEELLGHAKLKVFRSCINTINEFYSYQWKEDSIKNREVIKKNDHAMDCVRYFANHLARDVDRDIIEEMGPA